MDLEQIRKAMREGTFGQGVLKSVEDVRREAAEAKAIPDVIADALDTKNAHGATEAARIVTTNLAYRQGTSDKVYNVHLDRLADGDFQVTIEWGRRTHSLQRQIKGKYPSQGKAEHVFADLVKAKQKKGYTKL